MDKHKKSLIAKSCLIVLLLLIPLLPTSTRPLFLYFLLNLLIIVLGAEAGFLSFPKPLENNKQVTVTHKQAEKKTEMPGEVSSLDESIAGINSDEMEKRTSSEGLFIEGSSVKTEMVTEKAVKIEEQEEVVGGLSGQELYTKAETFIGNFYKQQRIQREFS